MTDIMIDMTSRPYKRYEVHRCHYCDHDKYPEGKIIDPTSDHNAKQTEKGDWVCGVCVLKEVKNSCRCSMETYRNKKNISFTVTDSNFVDPEIASYIYYPCKYLR